MASMTQTDLSTLREDELSDLLSKVKSAHQTQALRARLPVQLMPFASNITIAEPIQSLSSSKKDGLWYSSFGVNERQIRMAITVNPPRRNNKVKILELVWQDWWTSVKHGTGSADSCLFSISLQYGSPNARPVEFSKNDERRRRSNDKRFAEAFIGEYGDSGQSLYECSHGEIKNLVRKVVRDLGANPDEVNELEVIEALLGDRDDARGLLERGPDGRPVLMEVIEYELEVDEKG